MKMNRGSAHEPLRSTEHLSTDSYCLIEERESVFKGVAPDRLTVSWWMASCTCVHRQHKVHPVGYLGETRKLEGDVGIWVGISKRS